MRQAHAHGAAGGNGTKTAFAAVGGARFERILTTPSPTVQHLAVCHVLAGGRVKDA